MATKRISVTITHAELASIQSQRWETFINWRLRQHGIPVKGHKIFNGVTTGVLRVQRNEDAALFDWWPTTKDALDDGVIVPDSPKSREVRHEDDDRIIH